MPQDGVDAAWRARDQVVLTPLVFWVLWGGIFSLSLGEIEHRE